MVDRISKPIVILLRHHEKNLTKYNQDKNALVHAQLQQTSNEVVELDEELKNDFRWLVNYDLKSLHLHDIDGVADDEEKENQSSCTVMPNTANPIKEPVTREEDALSCERKSLPFTYTSMIEQCLTENGEATVQTIYSWIMERFPHFDPTDAGWKNAVRHTLTVNPMFEKKKTNVGKCHLWYLEKKVQTFPVEGMHYQIMQDVSYVELQGIPNVFPDSVNYISFDASNDTLLTQMPNNMSPQDQGISKQLWQKTGDFNGDEYVPELKQEAPHLEDFQAPIEFLTESDYTEPMEVKCLLDENAATFPLQLL